MEYIVAVLFCHLLMVYSIAARLGNLFSRWEVLRLFPLNSYKSRLDQCLQFFMQALASNSSILIPLRKICSFISLPVLWRNKISEVYATSFLESMNPKIYFKQTLQGAILFCYTNHGQVAGVSFS